MNKYKEAAITGMGMAADDLIEYTRKNTDFEVAIYADSYPIRFVFTPSADALQQSLFEADENGVAGEMTVIYSSGGSGVDLGLACHMQTDVFEKALEQMRRLRRSVPSRI